MSDRPLVLVIDDLHRADDSSLLLLRFLARDLGDARLLVVATYRDSRADQSEEFVRTLAELTREPVTSRVVLRGFDKGEVARFVELAASMAIPDSFAAKLHARTSGNPLFLKEVVLPLADGHDPAEFEHGLDDFVPDVVQEAVERRLAYIPEGARDVLDQASVIGQQFTLEVLVEVTGLERSKLLGLLGQAMALDYVTLAPDPGANRFRFAHVLIRDALFRRLPPRPPSRPPPAGGGSAGEGVRRRPRGPVHRAGPPIHECGRGDRQPEVAGLSPAGRRAGGGQVRLRGCSAAVRERAAAAHQPVAPLRPTPGPGRRPDEGGPGPAGSQHLHTGR